MKRLALAFVCLLSGLAFGQGGAVTAVPAITNTRGEPVPYAQVAVCSSNPGSAPTTVCGGNFATVYTDITIATPCSNNVTPVGPISGTGCSNPGKSDGLGNVVAFAVAGQYWCEYYGGSITRPLVVPCFFASGGGGSASLNCANFSAIGALGYFTAANAFTCDNSFVTDGTGDWTAVSGKLIGPVNGFWGLIGGKPDPGTIPAYALSAHEFRWLAALSGAAYYARVPATTGTVGQVLYLASQTTDGNGNTVDVLSWLNSSISINSVTCALGSSCSVQGVRGLSFTIYNSGGLTSGSTAASTDYLTIPFACTIQAYNLAVDSGTITVKFWKVATGTAIPTSGNSINTSGVSISSGTAIHSTTLTDFTTTSVAANDIMAMNITAASGPTYVNGVLQCQ